MVVTALLFVVLAAGAAVPLILRLAGARHQLRLAVVDARTPEQVRRDIAVHQRYR